MIVERLPSVQALSPRDKYLLANELWEEIAADETSIPFDDAVVALLVQRYREYLEDPTRLISWEALKLKLGGG